MRTAPLGKTGLAVTRTALGCLPLQRRTTQEAVELIRAAYQEGITLYDTARSYTDSEYKLGLALEGVRDQVVIATKTPSTTVDGIKRDLETSLNMLKTDYVDIYQFHNPAELPLGDSPLYRQMEEFKRQGMIRHIGLTNHSADIALAAAESGLYETIQYPLSPLCTDRDLSVIATCQRLNIGLLAMKALSGGLITRAALSFAFLDRFEGVFPLDDRGNAAGGRGAAPGAFRRFLPGLRLLPALPCRYTHQHGGAHVAAPAPRALAELYYAPMAGKHGTDRRLPGLRRLRKPLSLPPADPEAAGEEPGGLPQLCGGPLPWLTPSRR